MPSRNNKKQSDCPFTNLSIEAAFGQEVHMFLHCHLRGYDRHGDGKQLDSEYYDKYGAPIDVQNSWMEGYHAVERVLADHFNLCIDEELEFPLVAGMAGGVHLYKPLHGANGKYKPWNWTGWVPLQRKWLCEGMFFSNRHFLAIRGNEIQNNLWDYHPHDEEEGEDTEDLEYSQLEPNDAYRGGYFFCDNPFGRYLHVISLKSPTADPITGRCKRYNYIVHPLAYRASIDSIPDNTVDAMQWSVINIAKEEHFGHQSPWGEKVNAMEIFNDFTYYYSYQPQPDKGIFTNNGELTQCDKSVEGETEYIYWFDTYPLEYGEFLLDSALARGVYLHTLTANDAFYQRRDTLSLNEAESDEETIKHHRETERVLLSDPKGALVQRNIEAVQKTTSNFPKSKMEKKLELLGQSNPKANEVLEFLRSRPYRSDTAFGYTTLIDTKQNLKETVFRNKKVPGIGLDAGELLALDHLIEGRFYSHTGVYDLFNYDSDNYQVIPFMIQNQPCPEKLCYCISKDMELVFTFPKCKPNKAGLVWRYSIMSETKSKTLETVHGYFTLSDSKKTILDLSKSYDKQSVKWLYFTATNQDNPMRRAWFNTIQGPAFGEAQCDAIELPDLQHQVFSTNVTSEDDQLIYLEQEPLPLELFPCESIDLDFTFARCTTEEEYNIYVYFMQVYSQQQDLTLEATNESCRMVPPRYLQSVHGYFTLNDEHPTRLDLSSSWDKSTVKDGKVYFYVIDVKKSQAITVNPQPNPFAVPFHDCAER